MEEGLLYFRDGRLVAQSGEVKVYEMNKELFLEIGPGHNLWTLESEFVDYLDQFKDKPKGECLEIGLGLGVASRCILSYPQVTRLTTVEKNRDVIQTHGQISPLLERAADTGRWASYDPDQHIILHCEGLSYLCQTKYKYDFIFMDFYANIDEDSLPEIADMVKAARRLLKKNGCIIGWLDPYTPSEYVGPFIKLFNNKKHEV